MKTVTYKYGIDFGTTNSSIACVKETEEGTREVAAFQVEINKKRPDFIRSIVAYKGEQAYVGDAVYQQTDSGASQIVTEVKTKLFHRNADDVCLTYNGREYLYSDIMAAILCHLKKCADEQKGDRHIDGVVMGIPNETDEKVKGVYYTALVKAGFYRDREEAIAKTEFLEESVAVALFYGAKQEWQNKRALIFDFGGGTLDLAVVDLKEQSLDSVKERHEVYSKSKLSTAGERITRELFLKVFLPQYSAEFFSGDETQTIRLLGKLCDSMTLDPSELWEELRRSPLGMRFIWKLERAKETLSFGEFADISLSLGEAGGRCSIKEIFIERADFEKAIDSELITIRQTIDALLGNPERPCPNIDIVLMAGGSSSIPAVRKLLENRFGKEKIYFDEYHRGYYYVNVMTCTALGFAYAGAMGGSAAVNDVTSFDYGFWDPVQEKVVVVIKKNTKYSEATYSRLTKEAKFYCDVRQTAPNQRYFGFDLYEGLEKVAHFKINNQNGSGKYRLYFYIDAERGLLQYAIYDRDYHIDITGNMLEEERSYNLNKE